MGRIRKLDTQTANMIAAGEVVERPAGIVKELVENALDAGASFISVSIATGGLSRIVVSDNGIGMDREDAVMAFERHATSKIRSQDDLFSIRSLGFRGEALPSIASVSLLTVVTCDGRESTRLKVAYGVKEEPEDAPADQGTEITVEGLFYHTPARLKHMRSANYEASLVLEMVRLAALANPLVAFELINDERILFKTSGRGDLAEVIDRAYGHEAACKGIEVCFGDDDFNVDGYLVSPDVTRASMRYMAFFINGRPIRNYRLSTAVREAYSGYISGDRYPLCALRIKTDPSLADVNVHPAKWEVRLSKQDQLCQLLKKEITAVMNTSLGLHEFKAKEAVYAKPLAFESADLFPSFSTKEEGIRLLKEEGTAYQPKEEGSAISPLAQAQLLGQLHDGYIVCQCPRGLILIDPAAGRKRVYAEEIKEKLKGPFVMNDLLTPLVIEVSGEAVTRLSELNACVKDFGIVFEPFGNSTLLLRRAPSWLTETDEAALLTDIVDLFNSNRSLNAQVISRLLLKRKSAHVKKRRLDESEMIALIEKLKLCANPYRSDDGETIMVIMTESELMKEFHR